MKYEERDHEQRITFLQTLRKIIKEKGADKIVYIDESGFMETCQRKHGWSQIGNKIHGDHPGKRQKRTNLIAGKLGKKMLAPVLFEGSTNASWLNKWLKDSLFKELPENATVIMDNAAFHKTAETRKIFNESIFDLLYLPPYSPDFNPIEQDFAILKKLRMYAAPNTPLDEIIYSYGS